MLKQKKRDILYDCDMIVLEVFEDPILYKEFCKEVEAWLRNRIQSHVMNLPSKGKTIK